MELESRLSGKKSTKLYPGWKSITGKVKKDISLETASMESLTKTGKHPLQRIPVNLAATSYLHRNSTYSHHKSRKCHPNNSFLTIT